MAYDEYTLYMNPNLMAVSEIPTSGIRLDDMTIAFVLMRCSQSTLHKNWPADFDARGMVKARRIPLGHAAKSWKSEGMVDIDGYVLTKAEEGFYYMWWRNIHCLCGKEGHDSKIYLIRPSHEQEGPKGFGFKVSSRAVVQLEAGESRDPNFAAGTVSSGATDSSRTSSSTTLNAVKTEETNF